MNIFKPSYYDEFRCIASKCRHSCCIGWEIDVDADKFEEYQKTESKFGDRLRSNIACGDIPHFILKDGDRCPFLNDENLCDIIINMGEDSLCQICADHPRFRNFYSDREEIGLGMCCEEAARIILTYENKVKIIGADSPGDEEALFFNMREQVFAIVQDREWTIDKRIENLCEFYDLDLPDKDWTEIYMSLERLDEAWTDKLQLLKKEKKTLNGDWDLPFEQILVYFIYRHLSEGLYDGRLKERLAFAVLSTQIIKRIFANGVQSTEELCEICRMYSGEVEYSEENVDYLLDVLGE